MGSRRSKIDHHHEASEIILRHRLEQTGWKKEQLLAMKLLLEGELDITAVAKLIGRHRNSINDWLRLFRNGGLQTLQTLLTRGKSLGPKGKMTPEARTELTEKLKEGAFRTARQAEAWLLEKHDIKFGKNSIYQVLGKLRGRLKVARPSHLKKDEEAALSFKTTLAEGSS